MNFKFKKVITSILSVLTMAILLPTNVNAEVKDSSDMKVTYSEKQITDMNKLYDMAKNGISDVETSNEKGIITSDKTGESMDVDAISTTQLLEVKQSKDVVSKTYVKTIFLDTDTIKNNSLRRDNKTESGWDKTGGVKATATVVYTTNSYGTYNTYIKVSSASGKWTISDGQILISNRKVVLNQSGTRPNGGMGIVQAQNKTPTSNSFSYNFPSSWYPVARELAGYVCGPGMSCTLKRGGSSWSFSYLLQP
ncbi:hypothetical protein [Clostridioides sp. ES-S-0001-02]|uniref:hypothetical protein n=1 Tax=Clostridioides sp. ES-S-0001-02 TaxID=2770770 RepID=UPI001D122D99